MAQQPRGRPPSQAPPALDRGRNALTLLGGGVLVLAVAGGAWALFGRDEPGSSTTTASDTTTSAPPVQGPVAPGTTPQAVTPTVSATSTAPVAASATPAQTATQAPTTAPTVQATASAEATTAPTAAPTAAPPVEEPAVTPPVTAPQQEGTVAAKDYTFKVARGDTLWDLATEVLQATGRSTSNASVAAFVPKLYDANAGTIGSDPDLILPGQTITWPAGL